MTKSIDTHQELASLFGQQPCWMIVPLAKELNYSVPSVRRFLLHAGYYSSFTHNGRWYTLSSIPRFNRDGLWFHQDIGFSKVGSLTNTLIALTNASAAGMTADQLGEKLRCRCHSVLVHLYRHGRLQRQKAGRSYLYLAVDPDTAKQQCQHLHQLQAAQLPAEIAVLVLAQFIRTPQASFKQLAQAVSRNTNLRIDAVQIQALFDRYRLKKTT